MRFRSLRRLLLVMSYLMLAPSWTHAQASDSTNIYGTWRWIETYNGGLSLFSSIPAACDCERFLSLKPSGTYEYVEQDTANEFALAEGVFEIHRVGAQPDARRPRFWFRLEHDLRGGGYRDDRAVFFHGPDTLSLRDCDVDGSLVIDGGAAIFVRELSRGTRKSAGARTRLPLSNRPERTDTPWEVDTSFTHSPVLIHRVAPAYPESLHLANVRGAVVLKVLVGKDGRVKEIHVLEGAQGLRILAVDAVKKWVFQPYWDGRKPMPVWIGISVPFPPDSSR